MWLLALRTHIWMFTDLVNDKISGVYTVSAIVIPEIPLSCNTLELVALEQVCLAFSSFLELCDGRNVT